MQRSIIKTVHVQADARQVWQAWSTAEGLQGFFAPHCEIDLWTGGRFEIWFFPGNPPGQRGAEGLKLLSFLPERMISFEWNAPPHLPEVRAHKNWVVVLLEPGESGGTTVTLHHLGWKQGEQWDAAFEYFDEAWEVVTGRFARSMAEGPIDWAALRS